MSIALFITTIWLSVGVIGISIGYCLWLREYKRYQSYNPLAEGLSHAADGLPYCWNLNPGPFVRVALNLEGVNV